MSRRPTDPIRPRDAAEWPQWVALGVLVAVVAFLAGGLMVAASLGVGCGV